MFQNIAPTSAPNTTASDQVLVDQPLADRIRNLVQLRPAKCEEVSREIEEGREGDRAHGADQARSDDRCDRVCGIVQAIEEVEGERDHDQGDEERKREFVHQE